MSKKMSKIAIASFVAASVIPVATVGAETPTDVTKVVIQRDGVNVTLSKNAYGLALALNQGGITVNDAKYVEVGGNYYTLNQYGLSLAQNNGDIAAGIAALVANTEPTTIEVKEGTIVDGELVFDSTPEENSIETFFYNLAA